MLILRCDVTGCGKETSGIWLPSGRIEANDPAFWLLPGAAFRVACCMDHALALNDVDPRPVADSTG